MPALLRRAIAVASIMSLGLLVPVSSASAEDFEVESPAGDFCPGFAVHGSITVEGSKKTLPGDRF